MQKIKNKLKNLGINILISLITIIISLLLFELVLNFLGLMGNENVYDRYDAEWLSFHQYDPELGWKGKPFAQTYFIADFSWIDIEESTKTFVRNNSQGFRGDEFIADSDIVLLGDSLIWGYGVSEQDMFANILANKTNKKIINLGISGYSTDQEYLIYKKLANKFNFKQVLLFVCENDFDDLTNAVVGGGYFKPLFIERNNKLLLANVPVIQHSIARKIVNFMKIHFRIYNFIDFETKFLLTRRLIEVSNKENRVKIKNSNIESIELFLTLEKKINDLTKSKNAELTVFLVPTREEVIQKKRGRYIVNLFKDIIEANKKIGIKTFDLYEILINDKLRENLYRDPWHFSEYGNKVIADELTKYVY